MVNSGLKQRLAAILAADAVAYSRLMAADAQATVEGLDAAREVFRTQIQLHQGRVIDMAGDSVLAVFDTATSAVCAALDIQGQFATTTAATAEDRRMRFRIGVHLGDVIEKPDGTVSGDGVNIAARLEGLAEAGGISVSESIRSAVKGKVRAAFEFQGEQNVKNLPDPVRAYRVRAVEPDAASAVLAFGSFRLDAANALLTQDGRALDLTPKAFAVLCHLAGRPGALVTKDQLLDAVWGRRFVSESVLKTAVNAIRSVLGDDPRLPRYIETVARRGYRFIGLAAAGATPTPTPTAAAATAELPATPSTTTSSTPSDPAPPAPASVPLIGRTEARVQLTAWLAAAAAGQRQVVLVGGEAGIGKSSLIRQLVDDARARGICVAVGQCVEQASGGEPYLPILDALSELARGAAGAVWLGALRQAAPTWLAQLPWLVTEADQARLRSELASAAQDRMLREFGALLDAATPAGPLLLVIEDLHWSDHATVSLLDYLARRRGPARWMLVASFRPTDLAISDHPMQALRQELRLHKLCRELVLEPFSEREVDAYLLHRLGGRVVAQHEALARALHAHTEGLPLFLANVIDDLESQGEGDGSWPGNGAAWADPATALARLHLPDTVVGIIERQIRRLPGELRDLLESASVVGLEFNHPLLAHVLGHEPDALRGRCEGLARRAEWLRSAGMAALPDGTLGTRYAFRHALYRRVFYERCAPGRRLQLHLRAAQALLAIFGPHGERIAAELAHHFEGARDTAAASGMELAGAARDAISWRLRAARAAVAVHAPLDALRHFAAAERAGMASAERVTVLGECAALEQQLGAGARALALSDEAVAVARTLDAPVLLQGAMLQHAVLAEDNDDHATAIHFIDELLATPPALVAEQQARALIVKSDALGGLGRLREADAVAQAALDQLPADAAEARAGHFLNRVMAHHRRGEFEPGLQVIAAGLLHCEASGNAAGAAGMMAARGVFLYALERVGEAEIALVDALERSRALHDVPRQRSAILNLVKLRTDRGDAEGALAWLDEGWHLSAGFESPMTECAFLSGFYYCNYLRGDLGAALHDASRVLESAAALSSVGWRVMSLVLVSDLYIHLGDTAFARSLIDEADALAQAQDMHHVWLQLSAHRAWLDVLGGDAVRALAALDALLEPGEAIQAELLAVIAQVRARAQLALGDPQAALHTLAGFDGAPTQEVWALMLALRLSAQVQTDTVNAADIERAGAELSDRRVPALESLALRQALIDALRRAGRLDDAAAQADLLVAHRGRLLASLAAAPEQLARFTRTLGADGNHHAP